MNELTGNLYADWDTIADLPADDPNRAKWLVPMAYLAMQSVLGHRSQAYGHLRLRAVRIVKSPLNQTNIGEDELEAYIASDGDQYDIDLESCEGVLFLNFVDPKNPDFEHIDPLFATHDYEVDLIKLFHAYVLDDNIFPLRNNVLLFPGMGNATTSHRVNLYGYANNVINHYLTKSAVDMQPTWYYGGFYLGHCRRYAATLAVHDICKKFAPVTTGRSTLRYSALYNEVRKEMRFAICEAKRRLGHVELQGSEGNLRFNGRTIYPYVDPRVLVDFVHKWGFSRRQFKDLRCFCDYAEWLSDSEDEPDD